MQRIRSFSAVCAVFSALSACGGAGNQSGPSAGGTDGARMMVPTFEVDPSWPMIPNDWVFGITSGLSIDADDNIWVLHRPRTVPEKLRDRAAPPVMVFDTDGNLIRAGEGRGTATSGRERNTGSSWITTASSGSPGAAKATTSS
ncbi:MAG: hypothetical protein OXT72_07705 [Gammaproteobacteria bacterium]|nr:hypothetical protein [Gammaproteobacteria bacterium]MDE0248650.1 hypothetical protein [Gammaproteobacteria bacterium]